MDAYRHFLSGVIASPRATAIANDNSYRRYRTAVRTSSTIGGVEDSRNATIFHEIGRAVATKGAALAVDENFAHCVEASYPTNAVVVEDFVGMAKKYSNFSATFEYSSLAGIVERLARGLAASTLFEDVTSLDLRGNRPLSVHALGTYDGPVNALTDTVFIPRIVNSAISGDVFSVLANAVAGEGSSVASDVVELDAATRQPIVPAVDAGGLPGACVEALRLLGANMLASDQGPLFALAFTRGLHRVLSLVGHTDEGGITRDLLRCGGFAAPFGGIHGALPRYAGIPALQFNHLSARAGYCDAILMATGAVVAHCDPGVTINGVWYPTLLNGTSPTEATVRPGESQDGTPAMAGRNRAQLLSRIGSFAGQYIPALARIFGAEGQSDLACRHFEAATKHLPTDPRHLRYPTVTPWFFVEPTGIIPADFLGSDAERHGSGSFGGKSSDQTRPAWESITAAGAGDVTMSGYHATFNSARRCWFLAHWLGHPLNGLGGIRVRQLDAAGVIQPGPHEHFPQVRDRLEDDVALSGYLWRRGQSPFCAPGEFLNLGQTMGFLVRHVTYDDDGIPNCEHVPSQREFGSCTVRIEVGRPMGMVNAASNAADSQARRARTRAANELGAADRRAQLYGRPDVVEMPTLHTAPRALRPADQTEDDESHGLQDGVRRPSLVRSAAPPLGATPARNPTGNPVRTVPHYEAQRFPTIPQRPGGGGGGFASGAPPPPPVGPAGPSGSGNDDPENDPRDEPTPVAAPVPPPAAAPANGPTQQ